MEKYEVHEILLGEDHPQWPLLRVFKLYSKSLKRYNYGCYTSKEEADKRNSMLTVRNNLNSPIRGKMANAIILDEAAEFK